MIESSEKICRRYSIALVAHRITWEYRILQAQGFPAELESFVEYWICRYVENFDDTFLDEVLNEILEKLSNAR